ncbi:MAG TPA: HlyD family secretion protein [Verrucomicrobiae bacterium]|nr:HlyD family secretion protein [Verrucomicrobiae bacterium]
MNTIEERRDLSQSPPAPHPDSRNGHTSTETPAATREQRLPDDDKASTNITPGNRKWLRLAIIGAAALVVGLAVGVYYFRFIGPYESTDDAFIEGHATAVAPQVSGRVVQLLVQDNQEVKQGDLLFAIDPRDYEAQLALAQANLAAARSQLTQSKAQFGVDQARLGQEQANLIAVEAQADYSKADLKRDQIIGSLGVSQDQIDLAESQAHSSAAQVEVARNQILAAQAQTALSQASIETSVANVQQNEADVRQAELNLSYTKVTAPETGYVTHRTVEQGAYVQPGQALLAIVPHHIWVVANFKETQLTYMRPGQPVEIKVDAYPQIKFKGHVDSIQHGSGASFSLFPPENATGNYIKVVQRVPVKIVFDDTLDAQIALGPGMSVDPKVHVK